MIARLKITRTGNSAGVVLPKALLAKLRAGAGEESVRMVLALAGGRNSAPAR